MPALREDLRLYDLGVLGESGRARGLSVSGPAELSASPLRRATRGSLFPGKVAHFFVTEVAQFLVSQNILGWNSGYPARNHLRRFRR